MSERGRRLRDSIGVEPPPQPLPTGEGHYGARLMGLGMMFV